MIEIPDEAYIELRDSAERYKTLIKTSPDAVTVTDLEGRITDVSERTLQIHGYANERDLLGKSAFELIAPEDHEKAAANLKKTLEEGTVRGLEYSLLRKDGSRFAGELNASLIKDNAGLPKAFIATTRDISLRKRMEEDLKESEHKWRTLVGNIPDIIMTVSREGTLLAINHTVKGISMEEAVGSSIFDFVLPEHCEVMRGAIDRVFGSGRPDSYEILGTGPEGPKSAWYETRVIPVERQGRVESVILISTDITGRKKAGEALRESEELYRSLAESAQDYISIVDAEGRLQYINSYAAGQVNQTPARLIGKKVEELLPRNVAERAMWEVKRVFDSGEPFTFETAFPMGEKDAWLEACMVPLRDMNGRVKAVLGITRDMTKFKKIEDELRDRMKDLKEFNDLAVGRELKLVEMEKEIERLKQQLARGGVA